MMAQMEDSGQRITKITEKGVCITAAVRKDIQQNRPLTDTMDEIAYNELKHENKKLKNKVREAEGELSIIKGIGNNSPEMKALQARVKELENSLSIALGTISSQQLEHKKRYDKDFLQEAEKEKKELEESYQESKRQAEERKAKLTK